MQITELKLPRIFSFSSSFFMLIQENDLKSVMRAGYVCVCCLYASFGGPRGEQTSQHSANYIAAVMLRVSMRPRVAQPRSRCPIPAQTAPNVTHTHTRTLV